MDYETRKLGDVELDRLDELSMEELGGVSASGGNVPVTAKEVVRLGKALSSEEAMSAR